MHKTILEIQQYYKNQQSLYVSSLTGPSSGSTIIALKDWLIYWSPASRRTAVRYPSSLDLRFADRCHSSSIIFYRKVIATIRRDYWPKCSRNRPCFMDFEEPLVNMLRENHHLTLYWEKYPSHSLTFNFLDLF
jgi:hypothetical protein